MTSITNNSKEIYLPASMCIHHSCGATDALFRSGGGKTHIHRHTRWNCTDDWETRSRMFSALRVWMRLTRIRDALCLQDRSGEEKKKRMACKQEMWENEMISHTEAEEAPWAALALFHWSLATIELSSWALCDPGGRRCDSAARLCG